ncbi:MULTISPECIES: SIR2 family protein [unclassified Arsenophonus]|uniref:SIR2 family protein n=1 Tax=unclassified Arsenophonus TaxID=2627083 RepID=UPI002859C477|nr:SIR2 family protein [Arsenophonus sp.]MDR5609199.1 SIR2 family protein [Arsenophonus sp.]MDR5612931.1 SIR2 family protein [Arsenophonus sp.]
MVAKYDLQAKLKAKKRTIRDLAEYIKINPGTTPNYSLFLGAGASVTSGIRTASDLVDEWREEIYKRLSSAEYSGKENAIEWFKQNHTDWFDSSNEYSSLFEMKFDLASQRRRFVEIQVDKKLPSIGYAYLVELFETNYFDTGFTTNFDDLINEAFYQFSSNRPLLCAHDSSIKGISISSARPKIIKLHGDYLFDSIKSSLKETENLEANTKEKLMDFAKEYGIIFVGYAGNDNSIMKVLKFLLKQDDYLKNGVYWCKRAGDEFSPEVLKLLNNDRVYWVEIDGFDEFMAELTHKLGVELSLGGNQKSTKREKMITNFIDDEYRLTNNEVISTDIKKLKKHAYTQDISSLINELSDKEFDDSKVPENEFKKLLSVDSLIKNKSYEQAELKIIKHLSTDLSEGIYVKYVQRLIKIYVERLDFKKSLEYSEKLIAIDPNNVSYHFTKAQQIQKPKEKIIYLRECLDKFKYSFSLRNFLSKCVLNYLSNTIDNDADVTYQDIAKWLNESLRFDGSFDNKAWYIKYNLIVDMHAGDIDKKTRISHCKSY